MTRITKDTSLEDIAKAAGFRASCAHANPELGTVYDMIEGLAQHIAILTKEVRQGYRDLDAEWKALISEIEERS